MPATYSKKIMHCLKVRKLFSGKCGPTPQLRCDEMRRRKTPFLLQQNHKECDFIPLDEFPEFCRLPCTFEIFCMVNTRYYVIKEFLDTVPSSLYLRDLKQEFSHTHMGQTFLETISIINVPG